MLLLLSTLLFVLAFFYYPLLIIAKIFLLIIIMLMFLDVALIFNPKKGVTARRIMAEKLSNGDDNKIIIELKSKYPYSIKAKVIDEIPDQFQVRDFSYSLNLKAHEEERIQYTLKPVKRGEYEFGKINVFVSTQIFFVRRKHAIKASKTVPVYPSYIQMRKYELLAISNKLTEGGIKKIRKVGQTMEFDQIRNYVPGDNYRSVNWKATARKAELMVNHYQDEKAQQVYSIIDKGRVMKMPFEGMSLLDYAINASLVISNIALQKQDKAGIFTFSDKPGAFLPAERKSLQMHKILDLLYKQKTKYLESDFAMVYANVKRRITRRSLLLFFTNFESVTSLKRQLPYLQLLAKNHLLVVIFFENTELKELTEKPAYTIEEVYTKTIAEKFAFEKKQIVKELEKYGIASILSAPQNLTVNTINKYLELKSMGKM